jgi:c-di-AMP phosphodiesterase-like protein
MENLKHLQREGSGYRVKQYKSLQHVIVLAWVIISILLLVFSGYLKTGIVLLVISSLLTMISFIPPRVYFDQESKLLTVANNGLNHRKFTYSLDDFEGFELQTLRIGFIPLGCFLYANFKNVSNFKRPVVSQSFRKRTMQEIVNELEDVNKK